MEIMIMKRSIIAHCLVLVFVGLAAQADQLAYNPRKDVDKAVAVIQQDIQKRNWRSAPCYMVSYCSMCDRDYVEVWEVKKVVAVAIPDSDHFEMQVFGRCLLRSTERIQKGKYREPIEYDVVPEEESEWFLKAIDMAYVYIPSADGSFRCLGKALRLQCDVLVERIKINQKEFAKLPEKQIANQ
jgi:hypothetical protein